MRQHDEGQTSETGSSSNALIQSDASGRGQASGRANGPQPETRSVPARPVERPGGEAALPCLKNNNSTEETLYYTQGSTRIVLQPQSETNGVKVLKHDANNRQLIECGNAQIWVGGLAPAEIKKSIALVENLKHMVELFGLERIGFLTLTFEDNVTDFKEVQRRFNSLASHILRKLFEHYIAVVEPQFRGAVHYHLAVVCEMDIRTGFDFAAFYACQREFKEHRHSQRFRELKVRYTASASHYLKGLWRQLRTTMKRYGFGRSELLPIRTNAAGIALYVGKYLEKGCLYRGTQFKGARMVRYSRGWKKVSQNFAWRESGVNSRNTIATVAALLGARDMEAIQEKAGRFWAYKALSILKAFPDAPPAEIARVLARRT